jgi:hypothetical protein
MMARWRSNAGFRSLSEPLAQRLRPRFMVAAEAKRSSSENPRRVSGRWSSRSENRETETRASGMMPEE